MKNYLLTLLIINFFSLGCENQKNITDDQVINIVREFFDAFDVNNKNRDESLSKILESKVKLEDDFVLKLVKELDLKSNETNYTI